MIKNVAITYQSVSVLDYKIKRDYSEKSKININAI